MTNTKLVVVHPPDEQGARQVTVGMARRAVRSREELARFLRDNEFSDEIDDPNLIEWRGGGSRTWGNSGTGPSDNSSWRRNATAIMMAVGLLTTAALFAIIGGKDASQALTYLGRLTGASLFIISFVALAAAFTVAVEYRLRRRLKFSAAIILFGVLTVLAANLILLVIQGVGREYTHWLLCWLSLAFWSGWALWELLHRQRVWKEIPQRKKFAAALSVGTLAAAANFTYTQMYKPYATPVMMTTSVKFGAPHVNPEDPGATIQLPLIIQFKNTGEVSTYIMGASYKVDGLTGGQTRKTPREIDSWHQDIQNDNPELNAYTDRTTAPPRTITYGMIMEPRGYWLDPGDDITEERIIEIPARKGTFNVIEAHIRAIMIRKDRMGVIGEPGDWKKLSWEKGKREAPSWVTKQEKVPANSEYVEYHIPLTYSNEILNLTRQPRYLTLWWMLGKGSDYHFSWIDIVAPDGEEIRGQKISERLGYKDKYGLINLDSGAVQVSYDQLLGTRPA
ncbi:hypothetical protein ABZ079_00010 [Streptomyces sp. NPDC006314]|uniref:hypothetical protein n=1 Tax=Streptomyces sp. NPDC006314 TaxID=3154475 RepID=UPI0033A92BEE